MKLPFARVLIVDDEIHSQMRVQFALEQVGFQCDLAADGFEALHLIAENRYHAVVTELVLPHTNGGELVIKLCAQNQAPIVVVHTRILEHEVYCGLKNEGVDAIYYKPTDYSTMARGIRTLVEGEFSSASPRWKKWRRGSTSENEFVQILRKGDGWIQSSNMRVETFRFTIVILACVLFGLGWGHSLDPRIAGVCKMFALCGFAFYFCLELVAYQRDQHRAKLLRWSAERRLAEHLEVQGDNVALRNSSHLSIAAHPIEV